MATAEEIIAKAQQLYVSYYGRPADPTGLAFWINEFGQSNNVDQALAAFGYSDEFLDAHEGSDTEELIDALYQQMFNRPADPEGLDFYTTLLESGQATLASIALDIANGADRAEDPTDSLALANKVIVANTFTAETEATGADYRAIHIPEAQSLLADVDDRQSTVIVGNIRAEELVAEIIDADTPDPSEHYVLTTGIDVIESGDSSDTFEATNLTLTSLDIIADASSTDNDILTVVQTVATTAATIKDIEQIRVLVDAFLGASAGFDASKITGATITISSEKLGFNGEAIVTGAGENIVTAGDNVLDITVTGLTTGQVNTGGASSATITGSVAETGTVNVSGDLALTLLNSRLVSISASVASEIDYDPEISTIVTSLKGTKNITLIMAAADIIVSAFVVDSTTGGTTTVRTSGSSFDATNFDVDVIQLAAGGTINATVASAAAILTSQQLDSLTLATTTSSASTISVSSAFDISTLDLSSAKMDSVLTATADLTIAELNVADNDIVLTGTGDIAITTSDAETISAISLSGDLTLSATTAAALEVIAGSGNNEITTIDAITTEYTGGSGVDIINAEAVANGTLIISLGAGNDRVNLGASINSASVTVDGGSGTDTLHLENGINTTNLTVFSAIRVEQLELENPQLNMVDTITASFLGSQLSGESFTIFTEELADTTTINITADATTTDLSRLTLTEIDNLVITGQASAETIKGSATDDEIIAAGGADVLSGNAGSNLFTFGTEHSTADDMARITDYTAAAAPPDSDAIALVSSAVAGDDSIDAKTMTNGGGTNIAYYTEAASIFAAATGTVNIVISDGVMSLSGLPADISLANTLDEWIDLALTGLAEGSANSLVFEFSGDTYLIEDDGNEVLPALTADTAITLGGTINIIELTGLSGIVALTDSGIAAANNVLIT